MGGGISAGLEVASFEGFPKHGVQLSFIEQFLAECGQDALEGLTTTDVCNKFVKPMTAPFHSSFCELMAAINHPAYGERATVFVSHAWKYCFLDVVSALRKQFENEPDVVIWFDLFSNNQHKAVNYDFTWWSTTFRSAISEFNRTVMVLSPWNDPIPLTRAWCLFELWSTADTGAKFEVAMSQEDIEAFLSEIVGDLSTSVAVLQKMLTTIDVERSESFNPADKEKIMSAVQNTCGFAKLNTMVFEKMRDWAFQTLEDATYERQENGRLRDLEAYKYAQGLLRLGLGDAGEAVGILRGVHEIYTEWYGEIHRYETLPLFLSYIEAKLRSGQFAESYTLEEDIAEVEQILEKLVEADKESPGDMCEEIFVTKRTLTLVYLQARRIDDAERLCSELSDEGTKNEEDTLLHNTIQASAGFNGASVHRLDALFDLAELWELQGKVSEAEKAYETIYEQRLLIYGMKGEEVWAAGERLIALYDKQEKKEQAQSIRTLFGMT
eukprot:gene36949-44825_t